MERATQLFSSAYRNTMENFSLTNFGMSALCLFYLLYANQSNLYRQSKLLSVEAALLLTKAMSPSFNMTAFF